MPLAAHFFLPLNVLTTQRSGGLTATKIKLAWAAWWVVCFVMSAVMLRQTIVAAANPVTQDNIAWNDHVVGKAYGLWSNGTTYLRVEDVIRAVRAAGQSVSWDGHTLRIMPDRHHISHLGNIHSGGGDIDILLGGTLVQRVTGLQTADPATGHLTTFLPIWYVMQVLSRIDIHGRWDGSTWRLWDQSLFDTGVGRFVASRAGVVSVAVYDAMNGETWLYHPDLTFDTASIVKVTIMGDLLAQVQSHEGSLSASERATMTRMIQYSDNDAATELWNLAGGSTGISRFLHQAGMTETTADTYGYWGLTRTTALDQVSLLRDFAYPNSVLQPFNRKYGLYLMEHVVAWQRWGISTGPTDKTTVALKNGWLPLSSSNWEINSIGYVHGGGRNYVIAVLSDGNPTEAYGIDTVEAISQMIWDDLPAKN